MWFKNWWWGEEGVKREMVIIKTRKTGNCEETLGCSILTSEVIMLGDNKF